MEATREDAALRRQAVLNALSELGYEVREGMAAAWAQNGRVVVRKPSEPNYGVELASPTVGTAVQARVVAFDNSGRLKPSAQRDREVELTWCSEFQQARESLDRDDFKPTLLCAKPAGEQPVKVVPPIDDECCEPKNTTDQRSLNQKHQQNRRLS